MQLNNFFQTLGKSLWTIEKHPFRKIGELQKGGDSKQLSYDPSRVFKNQDDKNHFDQDQQYLEFQREERFNILKLQKNLLVAEMKQKQEKNKVKISQIIKPNKQIYNPFISERQKCICCSDCLRFEGNFRINKIKSIGTFCCMNCGCPMNAHRQITKDRLFSGLLYQHLKDKHLSDDSMNINAFVGALSFQSSAKGLSLNKLINILGEGGFTVLSYQNMDQQKFIQKIVQQRIFSLKRRFSSPNDFQTTLNCVKFINNHTNRVQQLSEENYSEGMSEQLKQYKKLVKQVKQQFNFFGRSILILLLQSSQNKKQNYLKFMSTIADFLNNYKHIYCSSDNYISTIDCQIFFPQLFQIKYETFIQTSTDPKSSYALKDLLDLNQYIIIRDGFENVNRIDAQKALISIDSPHLVDYILRKNVVSQSIPRLNIKIVAKVGTPQLSIFGQLPPFIRFQQEKITHTLIKHLSSKSLDSQRCAIVLRPSLTSCGMDNMVVNFFRLNGFNIIGRTCVSLSPEQIRLMQIFQNIAQEDCSSYQEMMKGLVQIVLVSKRQAISQSKIIAEGCSYGVKKLKSRIIRQQPQFHIQINSKQYIQQLQVFQPKSWQQSSLYTFNGIKNIFNLENLIFGSPEKLQSAQLVEATTGNVIRQTSQNIKKKKISPKTKQAIFQDLNSQIFNFWIYSSISQTITQQIVSQFMPECAAYESICLIIKPGYGVLANSIKSQLVSLKYQIIFSKSLILSRVLAKEVVEKLSMLKSPQLLKKLASQYSSQRIELLCVAKESARREMLYFLRNFNLDSKNIISEGQLITDSILQDALVPVWKNQSLVLEIFHPVLQNIKLALTRIDKLQRNDLFNLLVYLVGSILGQEVKQLPLKTQIGQLSYFILKDAQEARIQSWYYSLLNRTSPLFVPLLFQHRTFDDLTFVVQSSYGQQLFKYIFRSYVQNKNSMTKGGRSLVLFLWAKKLADMVGQLTSTNPPLNGFGKITKFGDVFRGEINDSDYKTSETSRIKNLIKIWLERDQEVVRHLERVLEKRGFRERCQTKNKRLLPKVDEGNLRAVKSSRLTKLILKDEIQMIDPNNQLTKQSQLLTINLHNTLPQQMPKYWLWSQIYIILLKYGQPSSRFKQPAEQFLQLFIQISNKTIFQDLEMLAIELYIEIVERYENGCQFLLPMVKLGLLDFRRLGKLNQVDEVSGKKRKFIPKMDPSKKQQDSQIQVMQTLNRFNEYSYNVYGDVPLPDSDSLFRKDDPLHQAWIKQKRIVELIRQVPIQKQPRRGIYVQYQKKINQNQEQMRRKVEKQAIRYNQIDDKILYDEETGNKNIWYRQKHQSGFKPKAKMDQAIERQLIKLMQFKGANLG